MINGVKKGVMVRIKWNFKAYASVLVLSALTATVAEAYSVMINGEIFEADSRPTITVETVGELGMKVTITGGINLGDAVVQPPVDPDPVDPDPVDADPVDPGEDPNNGSSGDCTDTARISCLAQDIGPAKYPRGYETPTMIPAGQILSVPFSHGPASGGQQYGYVGHVAKTGASTGGLPLKVWMSNNPGGNPIRERDCADDYVREDATFEWNQNKDFRGYCRLPDVAGTVYVNYAVCSAPAGDRICADSSSKFSELDYKIIIFSNVQAY